MRKLLTGVCNNITQNIDKILLWNNSFKIVTGGDVILLAWNATEQDITTLENNNIMYEKVSNDTSETVNNQRLLPVSTFISSKVNDYDAILYTDVFDVAFLHDPFEKMDLYNYDVFVAGEGVTHGEEPWNTDVMAKCYPNEKQQHKDREVFCSGVIGGTPRALSNFVSDIWLTGLRSQKGHDIHDQAAMNINIYDTDYKRLKKFFIYDKWCLHMATGGPTQFFESWGFRRAIERKYGPIPHWKDFSIVHQFNRIPKIHDEIKKLYE